MQRRSTASLPSAENAGDQGVVTERAGALDQIVELAPPDFRAAGRSGVAT